jgi:hypothetical protein
MLGYVGELEQTIAEGRVGAVASIKNSVATGDWAAAVHTVQDAAAPRHRDHPWPGSYAALGFRDGILHFLADLFPSWSTIVAATVNSEALLAGASADTLPLFPPQHDQSPGVPMPERGVFGDVMRFGDNLFCYNGACR